MLCATQMKLAFSRGLQRQVVFAPCVPRLLPNRQYLKVGQTAAAAAEAASPAAAAAAATPAAESPAAASAQWQSSSTDIRVRIGANSEKTRSGKYIAERLREGADRVLVTAVGSPALWVALKTLARANEMLQVADSSSVLTFQPAYQKDTNVMQGKPVETWLVAFTVKKASAAQFSTQPAEGDKVMSIKRDTTSKKVGNHAAYRARQAEPQPAAAFKIWGVKGLMQQCSITIKGLTAARQELARTNGPDLVCTLSRSSEPRQAELAAAEGQQSEAAGAEDSEGSSSDATINSQPLAVATYLVIVHRVPAAATA